MDATQAEQILRDNWGSIIDGVRTAAGVSTNVAYETWLKPLEFASYINGTLSIYIPEALTNLTDYLSKQYAPFIKVLSAEQIGAELPPEIVFLRKTTYVEPPAPAVNPQTELIPNMTFLNPRYRFDTFVVGSNNSLAHAAALAVAESPGKAWNPLFLYGGPGLGKTHLMHSIAHMILDESPSMKVLYVTSEQFTNEVIESIGFNRRNMPDKMMLLREKYRTVDVLMIDDVQFIIGKDATQEEFFHTFNVLQQAGKQIVLSSDRPPKELETLEERLRSRFEQGLAADIQPPNYETRMAILRKNAEEEPCPIDDQSFAYVAENITTNIRELEGAFHKLVAYSRLHGVEMNLEHTKLALQDIIDPAASGAVTIDKVTDAVCEYYQVSKELVLSKKREASIVLPRQVAMYLVRTYLLDSLDAVGKYFGGRDHSTVMSSVDKIRKNLKTDEDLRKTIDVLRKKLALDIPKNL